jgi:hypothetical protein
MAKQQGTVYQKAAPGLRGMQPLRSSIGYAKSLAFGVALRVATDLRNHHGQITSIIERITHSFLQKSRLKSVPPEFRNGSRTSQQSNSIVQTQNTSSACLTVKFSKETNTILSSAESLIYPVWWA